MKFKPWPYQEFAIEKIKELPEVALFLAMGMGKSICTLMAIKALIYDSFGVTKVLLVAPLKVAESTWDDEVEKWEQVSDLTISKILGTQNERIRALNKQADIYIINRENVTWLVDYCKCEPFDMLVIDESSSFKSHQAKRFKALKRVRGCFDRVFCLTVTPTSNSLMDLWAQIYLLDQGKRLGKTIWAYRVKYFEPDKTNGHIVYSYRPKPGAEQAIYDAISDITFSMKASDWLCMPDLVSNPVSVTIYGKGLHMYKELEKEYILSMPEGDVTAANAAVLSNKLLQLANGAVYDENQKVVEIHRAKIEALAEIAEQGNNLLVFYTYKHDKDRLLEAFPYAKAYEGKQVGKEWNAGKIKMLIVHPASVGYGLNLQAGGNTIVWFGLTWSLEQYQQANARLYRQGQEQAVIVHHLIAKDTIDKRVLDALNHKKQGQDALIEAVKAKIAEYKAVK